MSFFMRVCVGGGGGMGVLGTAILVMILLINLVSLYIKYQNTVYYGGILLSVYFSH